MGTKFDPKRCGCVVTLIVNIYVVKCGLISMSLLSWLSPYWWQERPKWASSIDSKEKKILKVSVPHVTTI